MAALKDCLKLLRQANAGSQKKDALVDRLARLFDADLPTEEVFSFGARARAAEINKVKNVAQERSSRGKNVLQDGADETYYLGVEGHVLGFRQAIEPAVTADLTRLSSRLQRA